MYFLLLQDFQVIRYMVVNKPFKKVVLKTVLNYLKIVCHGSINLVNRHTYTK